MARIWEEYVWYILQAKDRVSARMADLCKGDKATRVEFVALVHVDTAEGCFDIGHGGDAIKRPDRGRFRHSPGHSEAGLLSSVIGWLVFGVIDIRVQLV